MHRTSLLKAEAFVESCFQNDPGRELTVLDVGSKCYDGHSAYRTLFGQHQVRYVGLDLEDGPGVDIVPEHPFVWKELEDESFDIVVCGQVFEHNPYFWVTFAEIARVLKPGAVAMVIAPGRGSVHRYPVDCWRFYPDSWQSLCSYTGLEVEETHFEESGRRRRERSLMWCDSTVIARKPQLNSAEQWEAFYSRLKQIAATAPESFAATKKSEQIGPVFDRYLSRIDYGDRKRGYFGSHIIRDWLRPLKQLFKSRNSQVRAKG